MNQNDSAVNIKMRKGLNTTVPWAEACALVGTSDVAVWADLTGRDALSIEKNWKIRGVPLAALAMALKKLKERGIKAVGNQNEGDSKPRFRIQKIQGRGVELENIPWEKFLEMPERKLEILFPKGLYGFEGEEPLPAKVAGGGGSSG